MEPVRIAMLGSGFVAGFYMQGLSDVPGQVVVANYSRSSERAREFASRWGIPQATTNLDELIARNGYYTELYNKQLLEEELARV